MQKEKSIQAITAIADSESAALGKKATGFRDEFNTAVNNIMTDTSNLKTKAEETVTKAEAFLQKSQSDFNAVKQGAKAVVDDSGGLGENIEEAVQEDAEKVDKAKAKAQKDFESELKNDLAGNLKKLTKVADKESQ